MCVCVYGKGRWEGGGCGVHIDHANYIAIICISTMQTTLLSYEESPLNQESEFHSFLYVVVVSKANLCRFYVLHTSICLKHYQFMHHNTLHLLCWVNFQQITYCNIFLIFPMKQILTFQADNLHEMSNSAFWKKRKWSLTDHLN